MSTLRFYLRLSFPLVLLTACNLHTLPKSPVPSGPATEATAKKNFLSSGAATCALWSEARYLNSVHLLLQDEPASPEALARGKVLLRSEGALGLLRNEFRTWRAALGNLSAEPLLRRIYRRLLSKNDPVANPAEEAFVAYWMGLAGASLDNGADGASWLEEIFFAVLFSDAFQSRHGDLAPVVALTNPPVSRALRERGPRRLTPHLSQTDFAFSFVLPCETTETP